VFVGGGPPWIGMKTAFHLLFFKGVRATWFRELTMTRQNY
jgi:hypothetical protein